MNNALINARAQLKANESANDNTAAPALRPVPNLPRSVAEHHANLDARASTPAPRADEAIEQAKAMFTVGHMASEFRMAYNSLTLEQRALILVAAQLDPSACISNFQDFDALSRTAICDGLKLIGALNQRFTRAVGSLNNLQPNQLH
ncbi:hypothetical protein LRP50_05315 [Enterovibrio sp. ZSDZ42]|uniref:Uncharacterized protein n=1 Tax=Enterovibrio gelatinilyticus TaxID=2899819 RepID=A0ABT5QWZ7_9GAMM|nr:hypothetical protein [Enterovibrio sp. ZSDZ42]MDD1792546.1 hypothetical protein [Enterovibrio sp. ZSDZ42]